MHQAMTSWNDYYQSVRPRLGNRKIGFDFIFNYLNSLGHTSFIVETGTYREEDNYTGDGCSTLLFDNYVRNHGGTLISIDIDPRACELARSATTQADVVESDSVEYLGTLNCHCDLLYLDSYNITDWRNDWDASSHHLKELFAAKNIIKENTLIVVDDNIKMYGNTRLGKGRLIYELMDSLGIDPAFDDYQIGWVWTDLLEE